MEQNRVGARSSKQRPPESGYHCRRPFPWLLPRRAKKGFGEIRRASGSLGNVVLESFMFFGIGFLLAVTVSLLFVSPVHNRAVRLTTRRLEAVTPQSIAQLRADKDQLRAECAVRIRRLELRIERITAEMAGHLVEIALSRWPGRTIRSIAIAAKRPRAIIIGPETRPALSFAGHGIWLMSEPVRRGENSAAGESGNRHSRPVSAMRRPADRHARGGKWWALR
jgi:hypothetical protein